MASLILSSTLQSAMVGHSMPLLTDEAPGWSSNVCLIRMNPLSLFEAAVPGAVVLKDVAEIRIELGLDSFCYEIADMLNLSNFPFPLISVATVFHFSIRLSGKHLTIFWRLSFAFTSAK